MAKVKVSYNVDSQTKEVLDDLKNHGYSNTSDLVNRVLRFDENSLEEIIKIANIIYNKDNEFNRLNLRNGMIILNKESADKLYHIDLNEMKDEDFDNARIENKIDEDDKFAAMEKNVHNCLRATARIINDYKRMEKRLEELEQKKDEN